MAPTPGSSSTPAPFSAKSSSAVSNSAASTVAIAANLNPQNNQRYRYQSEIQAMMYTFGDVRHPLSSTSLMVEDIVHSQIIELVMRN